MTLEWVLEKGLVITNYKMKILLVLTVLAAASALTLFLWRKYFTKPVFKFQNFGLVDIPYITMDIQGNQMNMIVDTGCGCSILNNIKGNKDIELLYRESQKKTQITALTPETNTMSNIIVDFDVNKKTISHEFCVYDNDDFGNFNAMYGISIHGLLGSDFLDKVNAKIDFKKHTLTVG